MCTSPHHVRPPDPRCYGTDAGERFRAAMQEQFDAAHLLSVSRLLEAAVEHDGEGCDPQFGELCAAARSLHDLLVHWHPIDPCWGYVNDREAARLLTAAVLFGQATAMDKKLGKGPSTRTLRRIDLLRARAKAWGRAEHLRRLEQRKGGAR